MEAKIARLNKLHDELQAQYPGKLSFLEFGVQLQTAYRQSLKPDCIPLHLAKLRDDDLKAFFRAVFGVAFFTETESEARDLGVIFAEAERRKLDALKDWNPRVGSGENATNSYRFSMVTDLYRTYMSSHLYEEARLLAEKYPVAGVLPPPRVGVSTDLEKANRVYDVSDDGRSMAIRPIDLNKGQKIVMVFSPGCGFSRQALDDIESDAFLLPFFKSHAVFIAPPSDVVEWKAHRDWNIERPAFRGHIAYTRQDWPELDLAGTPQFYFYRDGKLIFHCGGWMRPVRGRKAELVKGLQSIGLPVTEVSSGATIKSEIAFFNEWLSELQARYLAGNLSQKELADRLETAYRKSLKPECPLSQLAKLGDDDLKQLFQAVDAVARYSQSELEARDLKLIFSEAERRRIDVLENLQPRTSPGIQAPTYQSSMVEKLYKAFLLSRLFDEARVLIEKYPAAGLTSPPAVNVSASAGTAYRVYDVSDDGLSMNVRSLDWKKGQKIVMAFSPGCGFSRQAFADIEGDASLVAAFRKHALLVAPPGEVVEWQSYSSWNKEHPGLKGYIGYSMSDWPELDLAGTPRFYFFSDGMLNVRYDGWREPIADRKAELVKGLQSIGLAPLSK